MKIQTTTDVFKVCEILSAETGWKIKGSANRCPRPQYFIEGEKELLFLHADWAYEVAYIRVYFHGFYGETVESVRKDIQEQMSGKQLNRRYKIENGKVVMPEKADAYRRAILIKNIAGEEDNKKDFENILLNAFGYEKKETDEIIKLHYDRETLQLPTTPALIELLEEFDGAAA